MDKFEFHDKFIDRHIGPGDFEIKEMCETVGVNSLDELIDQTIPKEIRLDNELELPEQLSEFDYLKKIKEIASKNKIFKSYQGLGYYPTILPKAIQRNILENPGWYTQYTPYQAEISQGRLEALINFQTMIVDLTKLPIANASLLDEGTAAAEAMIMCNNVKKNKNATKFFVSNKCFPQTIDVILTRAEPLGIEVEIGDINKVQLNENYFAVIVQYPDLNGEVNDYKQFFEIAHSKGIYTITAADIMSLILLTPPGEFGSDVAVGSTQRFGVPMMFGGPHAAYFAAKDEFKRFLPGRIIGVSIDKFNNIAYRMALQTREQHIKREKATSNICTSQVLLAIIAAMYAIYHGPCGLTAIADRIHKLTILLNDKLKKLGFNQKNNLYFDTLLFEFDNQKVIEEIRSRAENKYVNFRYIDNKIGISINEQTTIEDIKEIIEIFIGKEIDYNLNEEYSNIKYNYPENLKRSSTFLTHPVFNKYYSEMEFMRYVKSLENKDLSLTGSMIPLGSCTMKLNAAVEMVAVTYPEFTEIHPYAPKEQTEGYQQLISELGEYLCKITGFKGITFQPNSGAQGEYTGLMMIRKYHISKGEKNRNVVLIPHSAHGTNPASAVMAGMKVVVVECDELGNIDIKDLEKKAFENKENLAALMVTYPSTHGVFEENIVEICNIIHKYGGQVYMDGANMNAQVGLTSPAKIGADCCHLNLHKTFAIPHGGGGPGEGPVAVAEHLVEFLPGHFFTNSNSKLKAVSSAPYGSAGILSISYAYILLSGKEGLKKATKVSILNANYIKSRLEKYYKVLYTGSKGRVGHELIFDLRDFKHKIKIDAIDVAKRLMDYGFHAPTVSFPVPGTLMVEPTESESKYELDRFCDAMISIRKEIQEIEEGKVSDDDNLLKNAPHTAIEISSDEWKHPYSRMKAAFPVENLKRNKFWPSVSRINDAYGDRNLVCTAPYTEK
ncbi:MAG: aminomethyl-transferring glycine dehydrogenase [Ignavibacteria bacterium]|nr:aminomethyl-transferring glycine dehydrogenase [Ignavibacteria bacterium]